MYTKYYLQFIHLLATVDDTRFTIYIPGTRFTPQILRYLGIVVQCRFMYDTDLREHHTTAV